MDQVFISHSTIKWFLNAKKNPGVFVYKKSDFESHKNCSVIEYSRQGKKYRYLMKGSYYTFSKLNRLVIIINKPVTAKHFVRGSK